MIYKHKKKKDYFVFEIELNYLKIEEHIEVGNKLEYIYFKDNEGQYYIMPRRCFHNEFEKEN